MTPRIKTTVVGSYPVPSWLVGNASRLVLRDAPIFLDCAREAGLHADVRFQHKFPPSELATVSVNFFTSRTPPA